MRGAEKPDGGREVMAERTWLEQLWTKALPCPFCGKKPDIFETMTGDAVAHRSSNCIMPYLWLRSEEDFKRWNTRAEIKTPAILPDAGAKLSR